MSIVVLMQLVIGFWPSFFIPFQIIEILSSILHQVSDLANLQHLTKTLCPRPRFSSNWGGCSSCGLNSFLVGCFWWPTIDTMITFIMAMIVIKMQFSNIFCCQFYLILHCHFSNKAAMHSTATNFIRSRLCSCLNNSWLNSWLNSRLPFSLPLDALLPFTLPIALYT